VPLASVTRLHLRSWRFLPAFAFYTLALSRQVKKAEGFLGGYLAGDDQQGSWTVTVWRNESVMRAFRASGAHLKAMPRLLTWCDEASVTHWTAADDAVPTTAVAFERLRSDGRVSKVNFPSSRQQHGQTVGSSPPQLGMNLVPARHRT
jgi:hypothetical protein